MRCHFTQPQCGRLVSLTTVLFIVFLTAAQASERGPERSPNHSDHRVDSDGDVKQQWQDHGYVANEFIVRFKSGVDRSRVAEINAAWGVTVIEEIMQLSAYRLRVPRGGNLDAMMRAYRRHPSVEYAEPNYLGRGGDIVPNDTLFPDSVAPE